MLDDDGRRHRRCVQRGIGFTDIVAWASSAIHRELCEESKSSYNSVDQFIYNVRKVQHSRRLFLLLSERKK